jgi:hypothetical protein
MNYWFKVRVYKFHRKINKEYSITKRIIGIRLNSCRNCPIGHHLYFYSQICFKDFNYDDSSNTGEIIRLYQGGR